MSFLEEIATEITQRGIAAPAVSGSDSGATLVAGEFVESDALQVRLLETGTAGEGVRIQERSGMKYVLQAMQIAVRGVDYTAARSKSQELYELMNGTFRNAWLSGTYYLSIDALQPPTFLGRDERDRWFFGFNLAAFKHPS